MNIVLVIGDRNPLPQNIIELFQALWTRVVTSIAPVAGSCTSRLVLTKGDQAISVTSS